ncbi:MAG: sigma-70 family RNA polymerase sigma factor [Solirubrobacteraceae bacterium]
MRRIQADDVRAFEELYHRHRARAFGLARVICRGAHRAEEATQDGFASVWRSRGSYDPVRGGARAWLLMVIRHRSIDLMRHEGAGDSRHVPDRVLDLLPAPGSLGEDTVKHDEAAQLRASLQKLPLFQREVVALGYFGGLTHTEIADRLGLPVGTVKGRMRRALLRVRDEV